MDCERVGRLHGDMHAALPVAVMVSIAVTDGQACSMQRVRARHFSWSHTGRHMRQWQTQARPACRAACWSSPSRLQVQCAGGPGLQCVPCRRLPFLLPAGHHYTVEECARLTAVRPPAVPSGPYSTGVATMRQQWWLLTCLQLPSVSSAVPCLRRRHHYGLCSCPEWHSKCVCPSRCCPVAMHLGMA